LKNISEEILKGCIKREARQQNALYVLCYSYLFAICLRYAKSREEAKDFLIICFHKVLDNIEKYQQAVPFDMWIRRVSINTIIDHHRKNHKKDSLIDYKEYDSLLSHDIANTYENEHLLVNADQIEVCLNKLPDMSRKVFNLFAIDGYSHQEISAMLKISEGTSKWHVSFARQQLKSMIHELLRKGKQ
jgi:RNA polymerase sigma factor (sigma-70 family)